MTVLVPAFPPTYGSSYTKNYRIFKNDFGDGYEQIIPNGLNNKTETWSLTWVLAKAESENLESQLNFFQGKTFQWQTPRGDTLSFTCAQYSKTFDSFDRFIVTATFQQSFSL